MRIGLFPPTSTQYYGNISIYRQISQVEVLEMSHLALYERHFVHDKLSTTTQTVSEARLMDSVPEQDEMQLDRIHYVLSMLQTILSKADPYLVPSSNLDTA